MCGSPWKSGPSGPRKPSEINAGFSPGGIVGGEANSKCENVWDYTIGENVLIHKLWRGKIMKKTIAAAVLSVCLSFVAGIAVADRVRDWRDLEAAHNHVKEAIHELDRAREANHYDMAGHGAKAEEHLRAAERELHEAIETIRAAR